MAYPERKPIYEAYESIIKEIAAGKINKEYADGEIDTLDQSLLQVFRDIRIKVYDGKG